MWCVAKVGGSLFDLPELGLRLQAYLRSVPQRLVMLVAGGGAWADAVRRAQPIHALSDEQCHHLAVEAMRTTARLLWALVPQARWAATLPEAPQASLSAPQWWVLDPVAFVHDDAQRAGERALPSSWDVTSDSIAARAAQRLQGELVLLKSTLPRGGSTSAAAAEGYVDAYFPRAAAGLAVRCVDLRSPTCRSCTLASDVEASNRSPG
jgi:aspartokinase-like uncharacterized kinase